MDIILLISIWIIVLYLVFGNQTKKKYKKGLTALKSHNLDLAEKCFQQIIDKHPDAKSKLEEITFERGVLAEESGNLHDAYDYFLTIQTKNNEAAKKLVIIDYQRGMSAKNSGDIDTAYGYFSKIADKNSMAFLEASKIDFKRGVDAEISKNISLAKAHYQRSSNFKNNPQIYYGSICRKLICELKSGSLPAEEDISIITNSYFDETLKNDLIYRYSLKLMREDVNYKRAIGFINDYVKQSVPEFENIKSHINFQQKSQIKDIIQDINKFLLNSESDTISLENLYNKIDSHNDVIDAFPDYSVEIHELKKNLFGKLQHAYLLEQRFAECLDYIIDFPEFFNYPELLKNAGICCIRLAFDNKINGSNYKKVIPIWLTAIYDDDIFIKSLEDTVWDDEYSFTVKTAIGKYGSFVYKRDWDNINQENPSDSIISIGDAQRELVNLFEKALNNIQPESLQNKIYAFYSEEKQAISELVELLGYDILHCTPEFAKKFNTGSTIVKNATSRYEIKENEKLLKVGSKYINLSIKNDGGVQLKTNSKFELYASSLYYEELALRHLKNKASSALFEDVFNSVIHRFKSIEDDFEEKSVSIVRELINTNPQDESLISLLEKLIPIIPSSDKIRFMYADFVTNLCITKINADSLTNTRGLELLFNAIIACPDSHKTAKNLAIFIRMNLSDDKFSEKLKSLIPSLRYNNNENIFNALQSELNPYRDTLKSLLNKANINYLRVKEGIAIIDNLLDTVKPSS